MPTVSKIASCGLLILSACFACGQDYTPPASVFHANQQVRVSGLPARAAESSIPSAVLAAALETIIRDRNVCCGKDSALEDDVPSSGDLSLDNVSKRLSGKHFLSDGNSIVIASEYLRPQAITPNQIVALLAAGQPLLMQWNSHFYVLYGAVFDETLYYDGRRDLAIHKLLLVDPRFSDARRETKFDRASDDWTKVQGFLTLTATAQ